MVDPAGKRTTANSAKDKFEKINEQLCSILEYCKKLEDNQNELIKMNELANEKIMKLNEKIEELKCEKETTETIENKLNDIEKNVTQEVKTNIEVMEISLTNKLENQEKAVQEKIKSYANTVSKNIDENEITKKEISSINLNFKELKTDVTKKLNEDKENKIKARKEMNVCLYRVPESKNTNAEISLKDDIKILKKIFENKIVLEEDDIKAVYRIGEKETNKTRPIIMKFNNQEKRLELLKLRALKYIESNEDIETRKEETETEDNNKCQSGQVLQKPDGISEETNGEVNNNCNKEKNDEKTGEKSDKTSIPKEKITYIFVHPDRTKQEQEEHRELVKTLKERKGNGESNLHIKDGKIVKYQPFREATQFCWV